MTSLEDSAGAIPVAELDHFEWLALEAAWAITKSPLPLQWERWQRFPDIQDPQSNIGMVVGGNLWRANLNRGSAEAIGFDDPLARAQLLSRAAGHIGKLAGGLIGTAVHFETPAKEWPSALDAHLDRVFAITGETLKQAATQETVSTDEGYYYGLLGPVSVAIKAMNGTPEGELLAMQSEVVKTLASVAVKTWSDFIAQNGSLILEPGATPRSTGKYIADLRTDFERYIPSIHQAATQRS